MHQIAPTDTRYWDDDQKSEALGSITSSLRNLDAAFQSNYSPDLVSRENRVSVRRHRSVGISGKALVLRPKTVTLPYFLEFHKNAGKFNLVLYVSMLNRKGVEKVEMEFRKVSAMTVKLCGRGRRGYRTH